MRRPFSRQVDGKLNNLSGGDPIMPLRRVLIVFVSFLFLILPALPVFAQGEHGGGEANLVLPDLTSVTFLGGINGSSLLMGGLVVSALGLVFGLVIYTKLRNMPVHSSMKEISELIYETCKTYLLTQGKFLLILEIFIGAAIVLYFGLLLHYEL